MNNNKNGMFAMGIKYVLRGMLTLLLAAQMVLVGAAETITYYHNDALGSPVAATDEAGNLLWQEAYRPYGSRLLKEDGGTNDTWFTGKQEDSGTGLSYFGARWYDPNIGRFMAIDPVGFNAGNIHSFNRYAYANNNPYKFVDPDGRESEVVGLGDLPENPKAGKGTAITAIGITAVVTLPYLAATTTGRLFLAGMELADLADGEIGPPGLKVPKKANPLDGTTYTDKVKRQMEGRDLDHNFPSLVDKQADAATVNKITGGDGTKRTKLELSGSINGKDGNFSWIVEPNKTINHRQFERSKK